MKTEVSTLPRQVLQLAERVQTSVTKLQAVDDQDKIYRLLLVFYMQRSVRLYGAVLTLLDKGFGIEASPLCRSLYEIGLTLAYLEKDPKALTRRLLDRGAVDLGKLAVAFKVARSKALIDEIYTPDQEADALREAGAVAKKYSDNIGSIWPEPAQLAKEVGMEAMHGVFYGLFNTVAHPSPLTIGHFVEEIPEGFMIHEPDPKVASVDLHLVTGLLLRQISQYNEVFARPFQMEINGLLKRRDDNEKLFNENPPSSSNYEI